MLSKKQVALILEAINKIMDDDNFGTGLVIVELKNGKLWRVMPAPSLPLPNDNYWEDSEG